MDEKEKAIAYDKALERAKDCLKDGTITSTAIDYISTIFPELRESEDERIKKAIIRILKGETTYTSNENTEEYVSWLEKQVSPDMVADAYLRGCNDTEKKWIEKQKDTNVLIQEASEKAYTEGMRVEREHWLEKQGEQKTAWSEEDEDNLRFAERHFKTLLTDTYYDTFRNWLKSLKTKLGGGEHDNVTSKTTKVGNSSITIEGMYNPTKDASV